MIIHSFDIESEPLMSPENFYGEQKHYCDLCIVLFSTEIRDELLRSYQCNEISHIQAVNGDIPIYLFEYENRKIAFYLSGVGSTAAATFVIEANWLTGAQKFIMFGSAGSLNQQKTKGNYVIPTESYRDDGMSYHYAEPSDYITIRNSQKMNDLFEELHLPYVNGRVWTTDAFYRETRRQVAKRQEEGCIAVEMELAGVQAVCDFHGFELYNFLVTGDVLDEEEYQFADLAQANHDFDKLYIALKIAERI